MANVLFATGLTCENTVNLLGTNAANPRFGYRLSGGEKGACQEGCRIVVAKTFAEAAEGKGTMWDSKKLHSAQTQNIEYAGAPLASGTRYYFSVQVFSKQGASSFCEPAWFETGLYKETDWQGAWIGVPNHDNGAAHRFRREFSLEKEVASARVYVAGLGYHELHINGKKQGSAVMEPGFTDYATRIFYATHDVTAALQKGQNCIAIELGKGWYKQCLFILQANITFTDGSKTSICSKGMEWDMVFSPITRTDIYIGENYDYRYESPGWNMPDATFNERFPLKGMEVYAQHMPWPGQERDPSYDDVDKKRFRAMEMPPPKGKLQAQPLEPIRVVKTLPAQTVTQPKPGVYVVDFAQNMAGWARFTANPETPHYVVLRYSELLHEDGTINQDHLKAAENYGSSEPMQTDIFYIAPGEGTYETKFTYHGFRYLQIEGFPGPVTPEAVTACVVRSDVAEIGSLQTANQLINKVQQNIMWGEASNLHSVPTDCPQRDERMGWLNDLTARAEESVFNYGMNRFFEKWVQDIRDAQCPVTGAVPDTAPQKRGQKPGDPVIASYLLCADLCYLHYGNKRIIEENYEGFQKWADYLWRHRENGLITYSYWGDWAGPWDFTTPTMCHAISSVTPGEFVSTCYLYYYYVLLARFARILGNREDAVLFDARAAETCRRINEEWYNAETGSYATGSQGCNSLALYLGLMPEEEAQKTADRLNEDVVARGYHLTTGNQCTKYVMETLAQYNHADTAFALAVQRSYPSWGFMVDNGATTIWERWENATGQGMNSHNHPMFASVSAYYYKYLAGIAPSYHAPGYAEFTVTPPALPVESLSFAGADLQTVRGPLKAHWQRADNSFTLRLTVPVGCFATVRLPAGAESRVTEGSTLVFGVGQQKAEGIELLGISGGRLSLRAGGGEYVFTVTG